MQQRVSKKEEEEMGIRIVCDACGGTIGENDAVYCDGCCEKVGTHSAIIEELEELVEVLQDTVNDMENALGKK